MKVLFVGDVHNHHYIFNDVERLDKEHNFDRIIFLGDYVDNWNTTNKESIETLNKVFALKNSNPDKYTFCIGNHELSYMGYPCSGHQYDENEVIIKTLLEDNKDLLDFYAEVLLGNRIFICTHSGITNDYAVNELDKYGEYIKVLEEMNKNKKMYLSLLNYCSYFRGGDSPYSSFVWADRREMYSILEREELVIPYQIIGHSPVETATRVNVDNIWFIDTHSTYRDGSDFGDKSYLMWNDTEFKVVY